jgi:hypothetical protein
MRLTIEVEIDHGHIVARDAGKLPERGTGLLTIISGEETAVKEHNTTRVQLPLIRGDGWRVINPTSDHLDASLWGD